MRAVVLHDDGHVDADYFIRQPLRLIQTARAVAMEPQPRSSPGPAHAGPFFNRALKSRCPVDARR